MFKKHSKSIRYKNWMPSKSVLKTEWKRESERDVSIEHSWPYVRLVGEEQWSIHEQIFVIVVWLYGNFPFFFQRFVFIFRLLLLVFSLWTYNKKPKRQLHSSTVLLTFRNMKIVIIPNEIRNVSYKFAKFFIWFDIFI